MNRKQGEVSGNILVCGNEPTLQQALGILTHCQALHFVNYYQASMASREYSGGQICFLGSQGAEKALKDTVLRLATLEEEESINREGDTPIFEFIAFIEWYGIL